MKRIFLILAVATAVAACAGQHSSLPVNIAKSDTAPPPTGFNFYGCGYQYPFAYIGASPDPESSAYLYAYENSGTTGGIPNSGFIPGGYTTPSEEYINQASNSTPSITVAANGTTGHVPYTPVKWASAFTIEPDSSDLHALVVNTQSCHYLWEYYHAVYVPSGPELTAYSGSRIDLTSVYIPPGTTTGFSTASHLPISELAITPEDISVGGTINHALGWDSVMGAMSENGYVYPAGMAEQIPYSTPPPSVGCPTSSCIPMPYGSRLLLTSPPDTSGWTTEALLIVGALEQYGMYQYDTGSDNVIIFACDSTGCPPMSTKTKGELAQIVIHDFTVIKPPPQEEGAPGSANQRICRSGAERIHSPDAPPGPVNSCL